MFSSTEYEYKALVEASIEAIWIKSLLVELEFIKTRSITINYKNQSIIKISKNSMYHDKTKHFEIHLNFIRDMTKKRESQSHQYTY